MRLLCSALLSANLLLGSSFSLLSPYHFLCQDNILPKNIFSFERTFVLSETPAESTPAADSSDVLNLSAPSVLLMEASTGTILYEKNSHTFLRPASITKIMTLILIFDAIESGQISLEDTVTVSEYAASMGGSQVFLEPNETQTVDTMIKCISIASANDACVAMAEFICGSEAAFVEKMNERAKGLGMNDTTFVNCCGLDVDGHMTSAYDVALMSRELTTKYPQIHNYSTIWMDTITHVTRRGSEEFGLTNTNKLIRFYDGATGLKTGSTDSAKYCLSATAEREGMELIAVVLKSPTGQQRFEDAKALLNYGFSTYALLHTVPEEPFPAIPVVLGETETVQPCIDPQEAVALLQKSQVGGLSQSVTLAEQVEAPVSTGQELGTLTLTDAAGETVQSIPIRAAQSVERLTFGTMLRRMLSAAFFAG